VGGPGDALVDGLLARGDGGGLLLRGGDPVPARAPPENIEVIYEGLHWLGLDWDEEPVSQTSRRERHDEAVQQLRHSGAVYENEGATWLRTGGKDVVFDDIVYGSNTTPIAGQKDFVVARSDGSPVYHMAVV